MRIGPYQLTTIETGTFGLDGGAMFGIVPKPLWERSIPSDTQNRISLHLRSLLIQGKDPDGTQRNILVDCGIGNKWATKLQERYAISFKKFSLKTALKAQNLSLEEITDVLITHLHFDHAGGLTSYDEKNIVPTFPNANIYIQKQNFQLAQNPNPKEKGSYLKENFLPYLTNTESKKRLTLLETSHTDPTGKTAFQKPDFREETIFPGISVLVSHGHTLGMQLVKITDGKTSLLYGADLIPTSAHLPLPFLMAYDTYPLFLLEEKKQILEQVVSQKTILFYEHCPHLEASTITKNQKGIFCVQKAFSLKASEQA